MHGGLNQYRYPPAISISCSPKAGKANAGSPMDGKDAALLLDVQAASEQPHKLLFGEKHCF